MQHKFLLILPISIIGLLSCMPDSTPKSLSYDDTLSYINKNYKELTNTPTGYVEYACEDVVASEGALQALGVKTPISTAGSNQIDEEFIKNYISYSSGQIQGRLLDVSLSLMYLSQTNFPIFVDNGANYSYQLTYVKELIMASTVKDQDGSIIFTYTRYYNTSLHLTRFEVNCAKSNESFTATQTFVY